MNKLNFRPKDVDRAMKEHDCIKTLQKQLAIHIEHGKYAAAQICIEDINKSLNELCKMRKTKREHDRLVKTVKSLQNQGIDLKVVTMNV